MQDMKHEDATGKIGEARCGSCASWGKCGKGEHTGVHRNKGRRAQVQANSERPKEGRYNAE